MSLSLCPIDLFLQEDSGLLLSPVFFVFQSQPPCPTCPHSQHFLTHVCPCIMCLSSLIARLKLSPAVVDFQTTPVCFLQSLNIPYLLVLLFTICLPRALGAHQTLPRSQSQLISLPVHECSSPQGYSGQCKAGPVHRPVTRLFPETSSVAPYLRIHLPMQGTRVQPLVWELRSHMQWSS